MKVSKHIFSILYLSGTSEKSGRSALGHVLPRSERPWLQRRSSRLLGTKFYVPNIRRGWQDRQAGGRRKQSHRTDGNVERGAS